MNLQPVDFTILKPQSRDFFKELFTQVLYASQLTSPLLTDDLASLSPSKNRQAVEEIFLKASRIDTLAMGLAYFLTETFKSLKGENDPVSKFVMWGSGLATDTLRTGLDFVGAL